MTIDIEQKTKYYKRIKKNIYCFQISHDKRDQDVVTDQGFSSTTEENRQRCINPSAVVRRSTGINKSMEILKAKILKYYLSFASTIPKTEWVQIVDDTKNQITKRRHLLNVT